MNEGAGPREATNSPASIQRRPRRYPRIALSLIYAIERFAREVCRGKERYARRIADIEVRRQIVSIDGLPPEFHGFTIAHLSDFHAGPFLDAATVAPVLAKVRAVKPDLIALTGDFLTHVADEGVALAAAFAEHGAKHGGVLVFGNHDYRHRREAEIAHAFAAHGIVALRNAQRVIERGRKRLVLAGIEDVEEGKYADLDAALAGRQPDDITILLAHHPDVAIDAAPRGVQLVLSGHTHGGQIVLFGHSVLGRSLRSRFPVGLTKVGDAWLHVTRGVGVLILPLRVHADPEIALLELRPRAPFSRS